jgi:ubiquinone/menaquinone biosynthesis C-methylase UbiE
MTTSTPPMTPEILKAGHRLMWATGDYAAVARHVDEAPARALLAALSGSGTGFGDLDVLDVATGSGNLALRLAALGADVTGLDLVDELLETAREREATAPPAAHAVDWLQGDAEALPFADASFDLTTSIFGIQFAPRHAQTAAELLRVTRPGGRIGLVNWTPDGMVGRMFGVLSEYLPAPPAFASAPPLWGDREHVAQLLGDGVTDLQHRPGVNTFRFPTLEAFAQFFEVNYGPTIAARAKLGGAWPACSERLRALFAELGSDGPDGFAIDSAFTVITARAA